MNKKKPIISIIIPTLNSENSLSLALKSIHQQQISKNTYEVLVVDGGSTDQTLSIARKFGASIIQNPDKTPEKAKALGLREAKGDYAMFLDSDEEIVLKNSLSDKLDFLKYNPEVKNIVCAGLQTPPHYSAICDYQNRYGDPFFYFMYHLDSSDFITGLSKKFKTNSIENGKYIFHISPQDTPPVVDGGGHFFDLNYLKKITDISGRDISSTVFISMVRETHSLGVINGDFIRHYSTSNIRTYLQKISWKIKNNLHHQASPGFASREKYQNKNFLLKKLLFIPYGLTLLFPIFDGVSLTLKHNKFVYILHPLFSFYTALVIVIEYLKKIFGISPNLGTYGKK